MDSEMTTGLIAEQAAFSDLAREIYARLSPGDTRLEYRSSILNGTSVTQFFAFNPSGKYKDPQTGERANAASASYELTQLARRLREACYREGTGTWFSLVLTVTAAGAASADYNYDLEPWWDVPVDPAAYVEDQEFFPRALSAQPQWLRQRLAEGQAHIEASGNKRSRR